MCILLIIFYFIWIPICFISGWADVCVYSHEIHWETITIGEFLMILGVSVTPLANLMEGLLSLDNLYRRGVCFTFLDKPLFHERD